MMVGAKRRLSATSWMIAWLAVAGAAAAEWPEACRLFSEGERPSNLGESLVRVTRERGDLPCGYLFGGLLQREAGDLSAAVRLLSEGLAVHPTDLHLLLELAVTLSWDDQTEQALEIYRRVLALDATSLPARLGEARMLSWLGDFAASERLYRELELESRARVDARRGLAFVYRARMQLEAATDLYRWLLEQDPEDSEASEGLEAIAGTRRWQIEASHRLSPSASADREPSFTVLLRYQHRARSFLTLALGREELSSQLPFSSPHTPSATRKTVRGGLGLGLGPKTHAGFQVEIEQHADAGAGFTHHLVGAEIARSVGKRTTLSTGLRVGHGGPQGATFLGSLGARISPASEHEVVLQVFGSRRTNGDEGIALAASWRAQLPHRGWLRIEGAIGDEPGSPFSMGSIAMGFRVEDRARIGLTYRRFDGSYRRSSLNAEVSYRF